MRVLIVRGFSMVQYRVPNRLPRVNNGILNPLLSRNELEINRSVCDWGTQLITRGKNARVRVNVLLRIEYTTIRKISSKYSRYIFSIRCF